MKKIATIRISQARASCGRRADYLSTRPAMVTAMPARCRGRADGGAQRRKLLLLTLGIIVPLLAAGALSGCQSLLEKANATESANTTTSSRSTKSGWPRMVTIPSGTVLLVSLDRPLRTDLDETGDEFQAHLAEAVRLDEMTVLPRGTEIHGRLTLVADPNRFAGKARMTLSFTQVVDPAERTLDIVVAPIVLVASGGVAVVDEKAGGGAVLGGLIAVTDSGGTPARSAVIGIAPGAVAGSTIVLSTNGRHIKLPASQRFAINLNEPLRVSVTQTMASR